MKAIIRRAVCLLLVLCMVTAVPAQAATSLPDSIYLTQEGRSTCTLCAAAMMLRARMYLSGNSQWSSITESGIRSTAWIEGTGLRWKFTYELNGYSATVSYASAAGMSVDTLKALLNNHPEGIVLYCGNLPHAVFATDYEAGTFYCAEPVASYGGNRMPLADSYLGDQYGSQDNILANVTAYWYVSSHSGSGTGGGTVSCDCSEDYAGTYICNVSTNSSLSIRAGHGTGYSILGYIPSGAEVKVTKASGTGSSDWAHVSYNGITGYASMQYLVEKGSYTGTPLTITKQPVSVTVAEGVQASVTVEAQGDGLTYQWYWASAGSSSFSAHEGATAKTYTVTMTAARDGRRVYCIIKDKYGKTVTSDTVTLNMERKTAETALEITKQPESVTVAEGMQASVTVKAVGDGLTYQWYGASAGSSSFTAHEGFTTNTYAVWMTAARDGRRVYCVITDQYGNSVTTNIVTLNMKKASGGTTGENDQPERCNCSTGYAGEYVCEAGAGSSLNIRSGHGTGYTVLGYIPTGAVVEVTKASGTGNRDWAHVVYNGVSGYVSMQYLVEYEEPVGTTLEITKQPESGTAAEGLKASVTVEAVGDGLTYQWYGAPMGSSSFTAYEGSTAATYAVWMTKPRDGRQVYCVITDQYGNTVTTDTVTLNMELETVVENEKPLVAVPVEKGLKVFALAESVGGGLICQWHWTPAGGINNTSLCKPLKTVCALYGLVLCHIGALDGSQANIA